MGNLDRQKILMIFGAALVCAFLMSWFVYAKVAGPRQEKLVKVVAASQDMRAGTRLKQADLKLISISEHDLPKNAVVDVKVAIDRVLLFPTNANEPIVANKLSTQGGMEGIAATIEQGKRAVSVPISDSTGAGGMVQPRSHVDVLFTRTGSMNEAVTTVLLQNVVVMSIGRNTEAAAVAGAPGAPAPTTSSVTATRAATLLVTPEQAARLEFARQQGKISLALRNPLDTAVDEETETVVTAEDLNIGETTRRIRGGKNLARGGPMPNVRNDDVWKRLTSGEAVVMNPDGSIVPAPKPVVKEAPKEPPKPKFVVDVFKGDKHLQEVFQ
ncbi:MAG: Flp pilus assembly protein CpaB [Acidobacteria bacterium]|nr:Flp pilus assembly protein CpaB [Acidobacteriota bacterium]